LVRTRHAKVDEKSRRLRKWFQAKSLASIASINGYVPAGVQSFQIWLKFVRMHGCSPSSQAA